MKGMIGMEIAVVFESMFGATHDVADAIAAGVAEAQRDATVTVLRVGDADPGRVAAADLLIVGGPTHMRGMTSGMSRKLAAQMEEKSEHDKGTPVGHGLEPDVGGPGLRDWFHQLPKTTQGRRAAAFDTRGEGAMMGGAAKGIGHRLESHGYTMVAEPEGFIIEGDAQLLRAGEQDRARAWAAGLVRAAATSGEGAVTPIAPPGRRSEIVRPAGAQLGPGSRRPAFRHPLVRLGRRPPQRAHGTVTRDQRPRNHPRIPGFPRSSHPVRRDGGPVPMRPETLGCGFRCS